MSPSHRTELFVDNLKRILKKAYGISLIFSDFNSNREHPSFFFHNPEFRHDSGQFGTGHWDGETCYFRLLSRECLRNFWQWIPFQIGRYVIFLTSAWEANLRLFSSTMSLHSSHGAVQVMEFNHCRSANANNW